MRIIVVGASGTMGKIVSAHLGARHEIVRVSRKSGDLSVDITDPASIRAMYQRAGAFDALVSCAGHVAFGPLGQLDEARYESSFRDKLLGQINLVRYGMERIEEGGSFTLTSGVLGGREVIVEGACAAMVNGALEAWVRSAAIELPRGARLNVVSPGVLVESLPTFGPHFRGHEAVPGQRVALAFEKSVEGRFTGRVIVVD